MILTSSSVREPEPFMGVCGADVCYVSMSTLRCVIIPYCMRYHTKAHDTWQGGVLWDRVG